MTQDVCKCDCAHTLYQCVYPLRPCWSPSVCVCVWAMCCTCMFKFPICICLCTSSPSHVNIHMHNDPEVCNKKNKQLLLACVRWIVLPRVCAKPNYPSVCVERSLLKKCSWVERLFLLRGWVRSHVYMCSEYFCTHPAQLPSLVAARYKNPARTVREWTDYNKPDDSAHSSTRKTRSKLILMSPSWKQNWSPFTFSCYWEQHPVSLYVTEVKWVVNVISHGL